MMRDPNAEPLCVLVVGDVIVASTVFLLAAIGAGLAMWLLFGFDGRVVASAVSSAATGYGLALWLLAREGRWL